MSKEKNKELDIVFLLDRSGSMSNCVEDTIGGFNSYINQNKEKIAFVTTVLFDDKYELLHDRKEVKKIKKLTSKEYYTRGCTALLDAIGTTIDDLDKKNPEKVLFIITTDGLENASYKYHKNQIKEKIEGHSNWEFIFIGADIDSFSEAESIGIRRENTSNYKKSKGCIGRLFESITSATDMMFEEESLDGSWKAKLDEYIENNQE